MSTLSQKKAKGRARRKKHIRKIVSGTAVRPRLVVFRSERQIYAQLVDDEAGITITGVSSLTPELRDSLKGKKPIETGQARGRSMRAQGA